MIAAAIGRGERTVFRILEGYERAEQLSALTIEAMLDQNIDPAARKHVEIVEQLHDLPEPETREEAAAVVTKTVANHVAKKKSLAAAKRQISSQEFASYVAMLFQNRCRSASVEEKTIELKCVFKHVAGVLGVSIDQLGHFGEDPLVPRVGKEVAA